MIIFHTLKATKVTFSAYRVGTFKPNKKRLYKVFAIIAHWSKLTIQHSKRNFMDSTPGGNIEMEISL